LSQNALIFSLISDLFCSIFHSPSIANYSSQIIHRKSSKNIKIQEM